MTKKKRFTLLECLRESRVEPRLEIDPWKISHGQRKAAAELALVAGTSSSSSTAKVLLCSPA